MASLTGTERKNIAPGLTVSIVLKKDQRTGKLTQGIVKDILTKAPVHTHGIKVRLESGEIGRVKVIETED
ncbi:MAG: YwbE family protein [Dyadobacter fermentans]